MRQPHSIPYRGSAPLRAALAAMLLLLPPLVAPALAADAYTTDLTAGLEAMRHGRADEAAKHYRAALDRDANDPAVWLAWGALLLNARQVIPARAAFHRASALAPQSPRVAMALALCDLADGRAKEADAKLEKAAARGSAAAPVHRAYLAAMRGDRQQAETLLGRLGGAEAKRPLTRAVRAWIAGKGDDALTVWEGLLDADTESRPSLLASFTPWKPFNHAWQAHANLAKPPSAPSGEPLSGSVPLTAQAAADTRYVAFSIDGVDAGITNVRPFTWTWDTTTSPNGVHVVRLTAVRADGSSKSQEMRVRTQNASAPAPRPHPGIEAAHAALDAALSLAPDLRFVRYALANAALDAGDTTLARRRLQGVVADDPKYQNAAHLLGTLPRDTDGAPVWKGPTGRKVIALTFDDGPNTQRTPALLDLLKQLDVRATFFFVGKQAAQFPEIVRRAAGDGHEVANHTWNHRNLQKLSEPEALRELAATSQVLTRITGRPPRFFRPPGGSLGPEARRAGAALNLTPAMWTFLGGKTEGMAVEVMAPEFIHAAQPGSIFLIHDGTKKIGEMLPIVVRQLREEGYEFVTLSELLERDEPSLRAARGEAAAP